MAFKFDVVVSGISGRFPECNDIDTFKKKLYKGNSNEFITSDDRKWNPGFRLNRFGKYLKTRLYNFTASSEILQVKNLKLEKILGDKAAVPDATGKFKQEIEFDYRMFKYNQLYARSTDVINRKVSEVSFEAIVDAGIKTSIVFFFSFYFMTIIYPLLPQANPIQQKTGNIESKRQQGFFQYK